MILIWMPEKSRQHKAMNEIYGNGYMEYMNNQQLSQVVQQNVYNTFQVVQQNVYNTLTEDIK